MPILKREWRGRLIKQGVTLVCASCGKKIRLGRKVIKVGAGPNGQLLHYSCYQRLMQKTAPELAKKNHSYALKYVQVTAKLYNKLARENVNCMLCRHSFKLGEVIAKKTSKPGRCYFMHSECHERIRANLKKVQVT